MGKKKPKQQEEPESFTGLGDSTYDDYCEAMDRDWEIRAKKGAKPKTYDILATKGDITVQVPMPSKWGLLGAVKQLYKLIEESEKAGS